MARRRHAPLGSGPANRSAADPLPRDPLARLRGTLPLLVTLSFRPGAPLRSAPVPLLRDAFPGIRGALALVVPFPFGARPQVRRAALAFHVNAPFGARSSDERTVPLVRPVLLLPSLEPAAVPLRRLLPPQRLAARLKGPGPSGRPEGAAPPGGALSSSPSRMPA